jgi:large subunit ribosomal protein L24
MCSEVFIMNAVKLSFRKNDQVEVIAGREKGKTGKVLAVNTKTGRVTVERVNMVKRHVKPSQKNPQGGVIEKELPLHYSNVQIFCAKCNRGVRHGHKFEATAGKKGAKKSAEGSAKQVKVRVCKRCGTNLEAA